VPSLLRGFSAPVNLTLDLSDSDLQFLMANDGDLYNRWQAAQDYATRVLVEAVKTVRAGEMPKPARAFVQALGVTLADEKLEPGYRAQFILLPSESDLARVIARDVDPLAIHKRATTCARRSARCCGDEFIEAYRRNEVKGPFSPSSEPAGRRMLRNTALGYLASRGAPRIRTRGAPLQAKPTTPPTKWRRSGSAQLRSPERAKALERFYER
jgi:aminopeptidase N